MDQVIASMKQRYQADRLRTSANENYNIIGLWKKNDGVGGCRMIEKSRNPFLTHVLFVKK
jgi:hypothetical protein